MSDDGGAEPTTEAGAEQSLIGTWYHSFEEDGDDGVITYRPATFDFPPSRMPRVSMKIETDGVASSAVPGAGDGSEYTAGSWHLEDGYLTTVVDGQSETFLIETKDDRAAALRVETRERTGNTNGGKEEE